MQTLSRPRYIQAMLIGVLQLLFGFLSMGFGQSEIERVIPERVGTLAYISTKANLDVIIIRSGLIESMVYQCSNQNEMILTPQVSYDRSTISFAVDNGTGLQAIHVLILKQESPDSWSARDSTLVRVNGGAWPQYTPTGNLYLSMKDPERLDFTPATDVYRVMGLNYIRISENSGSDRHLWPLIAPQGDLLHFRRIKKDADLEHIVAKQSIILNLKSGIQDIHLVDENIYVEQWTAHSGLLYSRLHTGENRYRSYFLYDVGSRQSTEIHRSNSWQAQLSVHENHLATLQQYPEGNAQFDIFITDLLSGEEINLTHSPQISESLIGWIN